MTQFLATVLLFVSVLTVVCSQEEEEVYGGLEFGVACWLFHKLP